jgi:pseudooxynicotine oxidase
MAERYDVIVVGGGFAGVTAARECALRGRRTLLLEARDRLGGRTWSAGWKGFPIEYGGAWVHWHQPHTFSELTRAGLPVAVSANVGRAHWHVGAERRTGTIEQRDAIARRGWDRFVEGVREALPQPHAPLAALPELARFDRLTIAERLAELELDEEEHDVLAGELESVAHGPLTEAGAVSILRWHALSGYSLELAQFTGGRVTIDGGTAALLGAIADAAVFDRRLEAPVAGVVRHDGHAEVHTRDGEAFVASAVIVAVALNALGGIEFSPPLPADKQSAIDLGQASRGIKVMIHARGESVLQNSLRFRHPFGYLSSETLLDDGTQLMIGFGGDAERCDPADLAGMQASLDETLPGYEVLSATTHDWLADEFSRGTWAIHRPGWYEHHHAAMRRPEGNVILAGSDLANGWAGFIDGAIESGLGAGAWATALD